MEKINKYKTFYQLYLDELDCILESNSINNKKKSILIQACCAPCSSEVLNELEKYFDITLYYYNPNTHPLSEYEKRFDQFKKLPNTFKIIKSEYNPNEYFEAIKGYELLGEFSKRCYKCFYLRMKETARKAKELGFDYFSTTLSISPFKKSDWINEIGIELEKELGIKFLYSDFKKKDGYKKSIEFSTKYNLYRQEYCGCIYSEKDVKEKYNQIIYI